MARLECCPQFSSQRTGVFQEFAGGQKYCFDTKKRAMHSNRPESTTMLCSANLHIATVVTFPDELFSARAAGGQ